MVLSGCLGAPGSGDEPEEDGFEWKFNSGFEENSEHVFAENTTAPCTDDIRGIDLSVQQNGDWEGDLEGPTFGEAQFCFGGGDRTQRGIDFVQDPDNSNNQVLFVEENYNISSIKKHISSADLSYIKEILKNNDLKKKILSLDLNPKKRLILISVKK